MRDYFFSRLNLRTDRYQRDYVNCVIIEFLLLKVKKNYSWPSWKGKKFSSLLAAVDNYSFIDQKIEQSHI